MKIHGSNGLPPVTQRTLDLSPSDPAAGGPRPIHPGLNAGDPRVEPGAELAELEEPVVLADAFREAELNLLAVRQDIRVDLEAIAERLEKIFGEERLSSDVKALGTTFKERVQAALQLARESMEESGTFDAESLTRVVQEAFADLRAGLEAALGTSFSEEVPGELSAGATGAGPVADASAEPSVKPPAPSVDDLRASVRALLARHSLAIADLGRGNTPNLDHLDASVRPYLEALRRPTGTRGGELDTAG